MDKGDWYYSKTFNLIYQAIKLPLAIKDSKKIIATTDKELILPIPEELMEYPHSYTQKALPSIAKSFIEKYITEYNKGNVIDKVMVEYDNDVNYLNSGGWKVKISTDNTINIKLIKDLWNRDEVIQLCWQAFVDHKCIDGKIKPADAEYLITPFNKWVDRTL